MNSSTVTNLLLMVLRVLAFLYRCNTVTEIIKKSLPSASSFRSSSRAAWLESEPERSIVEFFKVKRARNSPRTRLNSKYKSIGIRFTMLLICEYVNTYLRIEVMRRQKS